MTGSGLYERIYRAVRRVPRGKVATYGQIARLVGCGARQVGYALAALTEDNDVPWQRIINSQGRISLRRGGGHDDLQRWLLEDEGVAFSLRGEVDLARFGWRGGPAKPARRAAGNTRRRAPSGRTAKKR